MYLNCLICFLVAIASRAPLSLTVYSVVASRLKNYLTKNEFQTAQLRCFLLSDAWKKHHLKINAIEFESVLCFDSFFLNFFFAYKYFLSACHKTELTVINSTVYACIIDIYS